MARSSVAASVTPVPSLLLIGIAAQRRELLELVADPVHEDDLDPQAPQDGDVDQQVAEVLVGDDRAVDRDHEDLPLETGHVLEDPAQVRGLDRRRLRLAPAQPGAVRPRLARPRLRGGCLAVSGGIGRFAFSWKSRRTSRDLSGRRQAGTGCGGRTAPVGSKGDGREAVHALEARSADERTPVGAGACRPQRSGGTSRRASPSRVRDSSPPSRRSKSATITMSPSRSYRWAPESCRLLSGIV